MTSLFCKCGALISLDDEDVDLVNFLSWNCCDDTVVRAWFEGRNISIGEKIMGKKPRQMVDHIDGNKHNNQRNNLRFAYKMDNNRNQRKRSDNTSGYKGVSFNKRLRKYTAFIHVGKQIWLGTFPDAVSAAKAYNKAALKHFGEFACINKFDSVESDGKDVRQLTSQTSS